MRVFVSNHQHTLVGVNTTINGHHFGKGVFCWVCEWKIRFLYLQNVFSGLVYTNSMEPNFAEIYDTFEVTMLQDAYDTIKRLGLWEWFGTFEPHANEGFMFTSDMNVAMIGNALKFDGHSGSTFGWTMRMVHDIAKNGWENHKNAFIKNRGAPCPCRREKGKLAGWCGVAGGGVPACDH
jgi:hypothetical protein